MGSSMSSDSDSSTTDIKKKSVKTTDKDERVWTEMHPCKECAVVVERLPEEELANLLARNATKLKTMEKFRPRKTGCFAVSRNQQQTKTSDEQNNLKDLNLTDIMTDGNSEVITKKISSNHAASKKRIKKAKRKKSLNKSTSCRKPNVNHCHDESREFQLSLHTKKLDSEKSTEYQDCEKYPSSRIPRTDSMCKIENSEKSLKVCVNEASVSKRFKLSLKRTLTSDEGLRNKVSETKNLSETNDEDFENNVKIACKRKLYASQKDAVNVPKLRKRVKVEYLSYTNRRSINKRNSLRNRDSDHVDTLDHLQVNIDRSQNQKNDDMVPKKSSHLKSLHVAVKRLKKQDTTTPNKVDPVGPSNRHTEKHETVFNNLSNTLPIKATVQDQHIAKETRNRLITDYFFKIDKSRVLPEKTMKCLEEKEMEDAVLRKKWNIHKDVIIPLIDFKALKTSESGYVASEIEKLYQKYSSSFVFGNLSIPTLNTSHSPYRRSSTNFIDVSSMSDNVVKSPQNSVHTVTVQMETSTLSINEKPPHLERYSPVKSVEVSLNDNSSIINSEPGPRDAEKPTNRMDHTENLSPHTKEESKRHMDRELPRLSWITNNHEIRNHLSRTSEKSFKIASALTRRSSVSPKKRNASRLVQDKPELTNAQVPRAEITTGVQKVTKTPEKICIVSLTKNIDFLFDSDEVRKKLNSTTLVSNNSIHVVNQPDTCSVYGSETKQPKKSYRSVPAKEKVAKTSFPLNGMTMLNHSIMDEQDIWMDLGESSDNDAPKINTAVENDYTVQQSKSSEISPNFHNTVVSETVPCNTTKYMCTDSFAINDLACTIENCKDKNASTDIRRPAEFTQNCLSLIKNVTSKTTQYHSPNRPACITIETRSSGEETSTGSGIVEKRDHNTDHSKIDSDNLTKEMSFVDNYVDTFPSLYIDEDTQSSDAQDIPAIDIVEQLESSVDKDKSESDPLALTCTKSDTSTSNGCIGSVVVEVDQADDDTEVYMKKECIFCKKTFRSTYNLGKHLSTLHVRSTSRMCTICDKQLVTKNVVKHYLEHCGCTDISELCATECIICNKKFKNRRTLGYHIRRMHRIEKKHVSPNIASKTSKSYICTMCRSTYDSKEDLFLHMLTHTEQDLQDTYEVEKVKKQLESITDAREVIIPENQASGISESENAKAEEQVPPKLTGTSNSPTILAAAAVSTCEFSICLCHKAERLEMSYGVIIELAIVCKQCKTFFKTRKCFEDHFDSSLCARNSLSKVTPAMFCNKCRVILSSLQDMHSHIKKHSDLNVEMYISFLCKHCNVFFFSIGHLFYEHWFNHCKNPLYIADHSVFPNNIKIKIIEPNCTKDSNNDEPTESLLVADYQCHFCKKPFRTEVELKKHLISNHTCYQKINSPPQVSKIINPCFKLICSICNKDFADKSRFDTHVEEHRTIKNLLQIPKDLCKSSGDNPLSCNICKIEYDTTKDYENHLIKHDIIQEKYVCNYCALMMDSIKDFEHHSTEHKGTPEKPVSCKVIFATAKFHCKTCKLWFDSQAILDKHVSTHSNSVKARPELVEKLIEKSAKAVEKTSITIETSQQEPNNQIDDATAVIERNQQESIKDVEVTSTTIEKNRQESTDPIDDASAIIERNQQESISEVQETSTTIEKNQEFLKGIRTDQINNAIAIIEKNQEESPNEAEEASAITENNHQESISRVEKTIAIIERNLQESNYQIVPDDSISTHKKITSGRSIVIPSVIDLSDNSNSMDIEILPGEKNALEKEFTTKNSFLEEQLEKSSDEEPKKLSFLRVKDLKELLPYTCSKCNAEFNTEENLNNHNCNESIKARVRVSYICKTCTEIECDTVVDWHHHVMTHISIGSTLNSPGTWACIIDGPHGKKTCICTICRTYRSDILNEMQLHLLHGHAEVAAPLFNCKYCQSFKTDVKPEMERHLAAHFRSLETTPTSATSNSTTKPFRQLDNFINSQSNSVLPVGGSDTNSSAHLSVKNSNNVVQPSLAIPVNKESNNIPSPLTVLHSNNFQQPSPVISVRSLGNNLPPILTADNSNNFQHPVPISPDSSSRNNLTPTKPVNSTNNYQIPVSISSLPITSGNNVVPQFTLVSSFNNIQQPASMIPINSNNSSRTYTPVENSNNFELGVPFLPVPISENNLSPDQRVNASEWLSTIVQSCQNQSNNNPQFNGIANMVYRLPTPAANSIYSCSICHNYQCSTEQELKHHESLHQQTEYNEPSEKSYRCKLCKQYLYGSEDNLRAHVLTCHKSGKSNVSENQIPTVTAHASFKCNHCPQVFSSYNVYLQHRNTFHTFLFINQQENETQLQTRYPYSCHICSTGFLQETHLQAHVRQLHPNDQVAHPKILHNQALFKCGTCNLLLISETALNAHMRSHNIINQQ
ncbi:uncharacterized protein [Neodiprion pinetum]|uniref:uncharacterized protein n=1 Tax=Neodiprion pinetum TaxID=441929 RepID=UPI001EE11A25|nr:uncharacterized protein LOC124222593 [Neodiprion pinetum]XP_046489828.1 uncharacterized protein LOC124222593 [Neodiprion pinetum]XP_046489901.1 uncharacterized protein LOC124222593 [Neodiprion pinetum]